VSIAGVWAVVALVAGGSAAVAQQRPDAGAAPVRPARGLSYIKTEKAFPTGDRSTSAVLLERSAPVDARPNQEFMYEIRVTNLTRAPIEQLVLTEQFPAGFRARTIVPSPARRDQNQAEWLIASLAAGTSETVQVLGLTERPDELTWCASVTFRTSLCASTRIVEPRLVLTKTAPQSVLLCDEIPIRLVVGNNGTGTARNVRIADTLPTGLATADGRNSFVFEAGDLAAGQTREFSIIAKASRPGEYRNVARAGEDGGLSAEASATTTVRQPALTIRKTAPATRFVGRPAQFEVTVQNTGDAPARDTVVTDAIPAGAEFIGADGDGRFADGRVTWSLGTLAPRDARTIRLTLRPTQIGKLTNVVAARAYCAEASASATLDVLGIPAVLLECSDNPDPIEIGGDVTYEVIVTNQGSALATNIVIECTLPPEVEFRTAAGPTTYAVTGESVRFAPLASLAPKARATYTIMVRGTREGDVRFKVVMKTDQTDTIVEETESTHIY
jgi:uncharacterized repeat protein (TIGR01451 family)